MKNYAAILDNLQNSILRNDANLMADLIKNPTRINIYNEGYRIRLSGAVRSDYPTLEYYLSPEIMEKYLHDYVETIPSNFYSLDDYPIGFAQYIKKHCPDKFAAELAELESAIAEIFWLPDSACFTPPKDLTPEALMDLQVNLRLAAKLLIHNHNSNQYIKDFREDLSPTTPQIKETYLLVLRHENTVQRHQLAQGEYLIIDAINKGKTIGSAIEQVIEQQKDLLPEIAANLQIWVANWMQSGFFRKPSESPFQHQAS